MTTLRIRPGLTGQNYAIFDSEESADEYQWLYHDCQRVNFGLYRNAYILRKKHLTSPNEKGGHDD